MADLSNILQSLGIGPKPSWLPTDGSFDMNPDQQFGGTPAPVAQDPLPPQNAMQDTAPAPRQRMSLLDTIGKVSDALARIGDETPLYQGAKDDALARSQAEENRRRALVNDDLAGTKTRQEIATGQATADKTNFETKAMQHGGALRGLQALLKANPNADIATAWPILAQQAGLSHDDALQTWQLIEANPNSIPDLAAQYEKQRAGGSGPEFGKAPSIAVNPKTGERIAYQVDSAGNYHQVALPDGFAPADNFSMVDTGGNVVPVSKVTGTPGGAPIVKTTTPEGDANRGQALNFHDNPKPKEAPVTPAAAFTGYRTARGSLVNLIHGLEELAADPGLDKATGTEGQITKHLPAGMGGGETQRILARIETLKGKTIPAALNQMRGVDGKLGFRPSQAEVLGDAKGLTGALDSTKQSKADYVASIKSNLAQLYTRLAEIDEDALHNHYVVKGPDGKLHRPPAERPKLTPKASTPGAPTVSNWH